MPTRRGFVRPSANGHAFEYADGTPFILLGDTWYAASTSRFKWYDDDQERPIGPAAGFKDFVRLRKRQGFNSVAIIAAFPNWANDGQPWEIWIDEKADLGVRSAWVDQGEIANHKPRAQWHAKDMSNEGGRAFLFPGKVPGYEQVFPDVDRINPDYFKYLDRKIDYLNAQGFIPFIEVARRDMTSCWAKYYDWPASYSRFVEYVWSRYQANNCLFSPVHYDYPVMTATPSQLNQAANLVIEKYGLPAVWHARVLQRLGFQPGEFRRAGAEPLAHVPSNRQPAGTRCLLVSDGHLSCQPAAARPERRAVLLRHGRQTLSAIQIWRAGRDGDR